MDSEENKMKTSDTPRSDAAEYLQYDTEPPLPLGLVDVEFARKLEIELNTAIVNEAFAENKAYMIEKELKQAQDRIKRLESDAISAKWMWMMNYCKAHGFSPTLGWESAEKAWTAAFEAKEPKP
jgi:hypothetical protein